MIKRLLATSAIIITLIIALPNIASAHVLKVDGNIGAVLHINPDDNPTVGHPTDYVISFNDGTGEFSLPECNCSMSFIENGKTIDTKPLSVSGDQTSENHYTFTKSNVYTMRLTGTPKTPGTFQPFNLNYEVRVTGGQSDTQPIPLLLWIGMSMAIALILLAAFAMEGSDTIPRDKGESI